MGLRNCCEYGSELWGPINGRNLYKILDVKPCRLASGLLGLLDTEYEGNTIFRNVGNCSPGDAVSHLHLSAWCVDFPIIVVPMVSK